MVRVRNLLEIGRSTWRILGRPEVDSHFRRSHVALPSVLASRTADFSSERRWILCGLCNGSAQPVEFWRLLPNDVSLCEIRDHHIAHHSSEGQHRCNTTCRSQAYTGLNYLYTIQLTGKEGASVMVREGTELGNSVCHYFKKRAQLGLPDTMA